MRFVINPFTKKLDAINDDGFIPPDVPLVFHTPNGAAAASANIINFLGSFVSTNNNNGIDFEGSTNDVTVLLTNRIQGESSTIGAVTADVLTFVLPATGTYTFDVNISGYDAATPLAAGYKLFGTVRSSGGVATLVGAPDKVVHEEGALVAANGDIVVSGNSAIVRVTGVVGLTINWGVTGTYLFRGV